ncbi:OadG family protein [Paramaledivibacter caminithermalis]|jgi:sodium pump decarboxylase gamma subunit|uniref:Sodium pump decarboxylases, gamma subunit n=1 Tax=Paramaledivibacter caminithermalis (strain DSM 15212 / CIP 107654 / DViRD3) TaxID=1121301 RepID=A0A1M6N0S7_PARC5|nr:OadG family protein [Paramaledivibacter caminithermalis]SHJ89331.1 sodium pump decarboxylases, gamma subunit [Paramaledivibacter caminithermalis DSM 15212]
MENLSLVDRLANPDLISTMTTGEKIMASLQVTLLGMAITFIALIILWGLIIVMSKALNTTQPKKKETNEVKVSPSLDVKPEIKEDLGENEELVAVITAAIAASLNTSTHNIVVKNIVRVADPTPAWGKAGRVEQMSKML